MPHNEFGYQWKTETEETLGSKMRGKSLMSPVEAAGYAMAPSLDDVSADDIDMTMFEQPDDALRNGHLLAADRNARSIVSVEQLMAMADASRFNWCRDLITGWWSGRAHA